MISVIVPAYNVEKYVRKCIESLVNQTYTDTEIILVDDGATDQTPAHRHCVMSLLKNIKMLSLITR